MPENLTLDIYVPTLADSDLAPNRESVVLILVNFTPYDLIVAWDKQTSGQLLKTTIDTIA